MNAPDIIGTIWQPARVVELWDGVAVVDVIELADVVVVKFERLRDRRPGRLPLRAFLDTHHQRAGKADADG